MHYFCSVLYFSKFLDLGVELPVDGTMPKHAGARSVYIKGAFVGIINEQFNSIKILTINKYENCKYVYLELQCKIYFINSPP